MSEGLLDLVADTLNAYNNITFIASIIVCLWWVIARTCVVSIIHLQSPIPNLKILCRTMVHAHLGGVLK